MIWWDITGEPVEILGIDNGELFIKVGDGYMFVRQGMMKHLKADNGSKEIADAIDNTTYNDKSVKITTKDV